MYRPVDRQCRVAPRPRSNDEGLNNRFVRAVSVASAVQTSPAFDRSCSNPPSDEILQPQTTSSATAVSQPFRDVPSSESATASFCAHIRGGPQSPASAIAGEFQQRHISVTLIRPHARFAQWKTVRVQRHGHSTAVTNCDKFARKALAISQKQPFARHCVERRAPKHSHGRLPKPQK